MGGIADAQANGRETGFGTTFHDEDYFFYALETGITPALNSANGAMPGAYRVGMWVDGQDKARFSNGKNCRDDTGFYVSCDQMLYKENSDPRDPQGLGVFGRFGYANSDLNPIRNFWSMGLQYQGLLDGRDDDVLGAGFAQGIFSDYPGANDGDNYTENHENPLEVYYNAQVNPWLSLSPSIQYITNTGGDKAVNDTVVFGLRAQMTF
jgi:porin